MSAGKHHADFSNSAGSAMGSPAEYSPRAVCRHGMTGLSFAEYDVINTLDRRMTVKDHQCKLSNVAKDYLETFYEIFDKMKSEMESVQFTDSISRDFIVQMIPHHMAAIRMS